LAGVGTDAKASIRNDSGTFRTDSEGDPGYLGLVGGYTFPLLGNAPKDVGWRFGVQTEATLGDSRTTLTVPDLGEVLIDAEVRLGATARFGHSWDKLWVYGLAGASASDFFVQDSEDDSKTMLLVGNLGLGSEYKIRKRLSLTLEILAVGSADETATFDGVRRTVSIDDHRALKLGVLWRF